MAETQIRFDDGLSYERYMGEWSRRVGSVFLDWLAAPSGLKWIDVGCGNGVGGFDVAPRALESPSRACCLVTISSEFKILAGVPIPGEAQNGVISVTIAD